MSLNHIVLGNDDPLTVQFNSVVANDIQTNDLVVVGNVTESASGFGSMTAPVAALNPSLKTYQLISTREVDGITPRYFLNMKGSIVRGAISQGSNFSDGTTLPANILAEYTVKTEVYQIANAITLDATSNQTNPCFALFGGAGNNTLTISCTWVSATPAVNGITCYDVTVELTKL